MPQGGALYPSVWTNFCKDNRRVEEGWESDRGR